MAIVQRGHVYRFYPNREQQILINKTFGCCRKVHNEILGLRKKLYDEEKKSMNKTACNNYVNNVLKNKYEWLREVDKYALTNAVYDLDSAYQHFFKDGSGFPKFKKRHDHRKSYTTNCVYKPNGVPTIEISFEKGKIKLPKLGWVKAKLHREFFGKIKSVTITQVPSGKYYISVMAEVEVVPKEKTPKIIGIDLGIKDLVVTSDGEKYDNIHTTKKYEEKLRKEQRKLSRMKKYSKNWEKQRIKVAKIHEKIHNTRVDYLHKVSHEIVDKNQIIVTEDLAVKNMVKNRRLSKSISDCGWGELRRQLEYKAEWSGREYRKIDRFAKTSQTCSNCGFINRKTKNLSVRKWTCPECGTVHDRDINAAINILEEGLKLEA